MIPKEVMIGATNLSKVYRVYARPADIFWETLTKRPRHRDIWALRDVSCEILRGEFIGIVGANGAGKSTLLKILAGTLDKTSGSLNILGKVSATLEVRTSFRPVRSGRENILVGGMAMGMRRSEIEAKLESTIDFSGLGDCIDQPFRTYSSGMQWRLAFATAASNKPDIFIVDEAHANCDGTFVQKCMEHLRETCASGSTVLLVSHCISVLPDLCNRILWLEKGRVQMFGDPRQVIQAYEPTLHAATTGGRTDAPTPWFFRAGPVAIERVELLNERGELATEFNTFDNLTVRVHYRCDGPPPTETLGLAISLIRKQDLLPVSQCNTQDLGDCKDVIAYVEAPYRVRAGVRGTIEATLQPLQLRPDEYLVSVGLLANVPGSRSYYEYHRYAYEFRVSNRNETFESLTYACVKWRHEPAIAANPGSIPVALPATVVAPPTKKLAHRTLLEEIRVVCFDLGGYPDRWLRHEACPCCGSRRSRPAFKKYGIAHAECQRCEFVFVNPYPPEELLHELYNGSYYNGVREYVERPKALAEVEDASASVALEYVQPLINFVRGRFGCGRWLDVGGGNGSFLAHVRKVFPAFEVSLQEINEQSIRFAQYVYKLPVVAESISGLHQRGLRYEVISLIGVFEHVSHPLEFLRALTALLTPGGVLLMSIPRLSRLNRLVSHGSTPSVCPPFHLSLFNERNLRHLLRRVEAYHRPHIEHNGPTAFQPMHFIPTGDVWDFEVPTEVKDHVRIWQTEAFDADANRAMGALGTALPGTEAYFRACDGTSLMCVAAVRRDSMELRQTA